MRAGCQSGQFSREAFSGYLRELFEGKLEKDADFVWTALADICATFGFSEHLAAVRRAWDDGLVDPYFDDWSHMEKRMKAGRFSESESKSYQFIEDAAEGMADWYCFKPEANFDEEEDGELPDDVPSWHDELDELGAVPGPIRVESKPGRNDPCPCGSGKKYKKCCG